MGKIWRKGQYIVDTETTSHAPEPIKQVFTQAEQDAFMGIDELGRAGVSAVDSSVPVVSYGVKVGIKKGSSASDARGVQR